MPETLTVSRVNLNPTTESPATTPLRFQIPGVCGAPEYGAGRLGKVGMEAAMTTTAVAGATVFDTLGWDTVFAIPATKVNECFAKPNAYPQNFKQTLDGILAAVTIEGTFGAWAITTGGSGALISLNLPISGGTATVTGQQSSYPLTGGSVNIQVALQYLEQTTTPWTIAVTTASRTSNVTTIVLASAPTEPLAVGQYINQTGITAAGATNFNSTALITAIVNATTYQYNDQQANDTGKGGQSVLANSVYNLYLNNTPSQGGQAVTVLGNPTIPGTTDTEILGLIGEAFSGFLNANLGLIEAVFNSVNLDMKVDNGAFQWLQPTSVGYAYYEPTGQTTIDNAVFAVLCMVGNNSPAQNSFELSPGAIPAGAQSGFSIGLEAFLTNMVMPTLPLTIGNNALLSDFALGADNTAVVNTQTISMKSVTVAASTYTPQMQKLNITVSGSTLVVYSLVHIPISPGIDTYVETTTSLTVSLVTAQDGTQTLGFTQSGTPVQNHWTCVATWIHITEGIIAVIALILTAIGGYFLTVPMAILAGIIIGLIAGLAALTPEIIAWVAGDGTASQVGTTAQLVVQATTPYSWAGGQQFQITLAQLNGTLQLGGNAFPTS